MSYFCINILGFMYGSFNLRVNNKLMCDCSSQSHGTPINSVFDDFLLGVASNDGQKIDLQVDCHEESPVLLIIVEKVTVFCEIVQLIKLNKTPVMIVLTKGFPSALTKAAIVFFANHIKKNSLCVFGDCNPWGIKIVANYAAVCDNEIKWLGFCPSQITSNFEIEQELLYKHEFLSDLDHSIIDGMFENDETDYEMKQELLIMKNNGRKYQTEMLLTLRNKGFRNFVAKIIDEMISVNKREWTDNEHKWMDVEVDKEMMED